MPTYQVQVEVTQTSVTMDTKMSAQSLLKWWTQNE